MSGGENQQFHFGYVKFKMPTAYPNKRCSIGSRKRNRRKQECREL